MAYIEDYHNLKRIYHTAGGARSVPGSSFRILNIPFYSSNDFASNVAENVIQPRNELAEYLKGKNEADEKAASSIRDLFEQEDCDVEQNNHFDYSMFKTENNERSKSVIILLHGFNEKYWDKYLPWAKTLLERTGKDVILFPVSFHMNRAPAAWSAPRLMKELSLIRNKIYPENSCSSLVNASISARLNIKPTRFLWSGIKTINDLIHLVKIIRSGGHPYIAPDASVDFFGYSIGAFLSEIVLMADPENLFGASRLFIFCGGPTFDLMDSVSKFIIDSSANSVLHDFYVENFDENICSNQFLASYYEKNTFSGHFFRSMLSQNKMKTERMNRFMEIGNRLCALALEQDLVMKPQSVIQTLEDEHKSIPINIEVMDYPYKYDHINPFPVNEKIQKAVNSSFEDTFNYVSDFLK
jgi:hypothetical protein